MTAPAGDGVTARLVFAASRWEDDEFVVTVRPDWEDPWRDRPIGPTMREKEARLVAGWLNGSAIDDIEKIVTNGYAPPRAPIAKEDHGRLHEPRGDNDKAK